MVSLHFPYHNYEWKIDAMNSGKILHIEGYPFFTPKSTESCGGFTAQITQGPSRQMKYALTAV